MSYAALYGGNASTEGSEDYSQYEGQYGSDFGGGGSDFDPNEPISAVPYDLAFLMPQSSVGFKVVRTITWGILGIVGMISNVLCASVIIKAKLYKSWTYGMILNLCVSDFIFCLKATVLTFPGVIIA